MAEAPNSYKDQYWTDLASNAESRIGLPSGLLSSIVTKGERSNADQVSEVGAKTPFQITPSTRKAAIDKYGIDPYLSPENAADVAGMLLKDSLDRNKGDVASAVAEYHGGTDRANWGPKTRAYVARVMVNQRQQPVQQTGSTFQRAMASQQSIQQHPNAISNVYQAYKYGRMSQEEAKQFEDDVNSGLVMLPRGAVLSGQKSQAPLSAPEPVMLPQGVTDAYVGNRMAPEERAQLEEDIRNGVVKLPPTKGSQIPTEEPGWTQPTEQPIIQQAKEPTLGEKLAGAGEAALTTVTGATGGTLGMIGGTGSQLVQNILNGTFGTQQAADLVDQAAMEGARSLTYEPRTPVGQQYAGNVGKVMEQLVPIGAIGGEMAALGRGMEAAKPAVSATSRAAVAPVVAGAGRAAEAVKSAAMDTVQAVKNAPSRVAETLGMREPTPTPGTMPSAGSAGTDIATMRREAAAELPVPARLTEGQATREHGQVQFEQETAKNPELGAPIRERMADQRRAVNQSFDAWIDETGAQAPDTRAVGISVDKALRDKAVRDKTEIKTAYKEAEKAGETAQPVTMQPLVDVLNESVSAESTAPVLTAARKELLRLGGASEDANGVLIANDITLANAEQLRKFVNKTTGYDPTNVKFASDIKTAIDASTEGAGGELYAKARSLRAKYANQYENHAVISDLLNNKRGMNDRKVALEDVFDRIVFRGSLDDMRTARRTLQTAGEDGKQAWRDIQGQALRYIRDEATKNVQRDEFGNQIISPAALDKAIRRLDNDGKLDYLFGKQGAEKLRTVNDLAKVMFTTPPGSVNTSNTASVLLAALDMAVSGSAGVPLPIMSAMRMMVKNIKDRKIKLRVQQALGTNTK